VELAGLQEGALAVTMATGAEVVTGSTRLKAGTATKLVLNMVSTGVLARLGYVYGNLMVNVQTTNAKLRDRAERIVVELTGLGRGEAAVLLERAGGVVKTAVVMQRLGVDADGARERLAAADGRLRGVLG
jgi:N-acetylmuramic acid 6-phosphate etherase